MATEYEIIIIGGGPAGLSAGIYAARSRRRCLLVEMGLIGGLITTTGQVENYPGFPEGIGGGELTALMHRQASGFGLETLNAEVSGISPDSRPMRVKTSQGDYGADAIIIAGGSDRMKLGVPGEAELAGRGVSYCATCDGFFYRQKQVAVIGGGDAALEEALHLTKFADRVYLIHRRDQFRATKIMQEKVLAEPKIEPRLSRIVTAVQGEAVVSNLQLQNPFTGESDQLKVDGVFVSIGFKPNTGYLKDILPLDKAGAIITDKSMATAVPGIYAAGDIRERAARQVISAAGDGATAALSAEKYLQEFH